jgi:hypothetical protein
MSLYPSNHPPFRPRGLAGDEVIEHMIAETGHLPLSRALGQATAAMMLLPLALETLRAALFRAEELAPQEPLPRAERSNPNPEWLPILAPALIETLEATRRCLEEWLESPTCRQLTSGNRTCGVSIEGDKSHG